MEKISGILPSSPRVSSVDMRDSSPVRPGTPGFGRPEGVNNLRDREIARQNAAAAAAAAPTGQRSVEAHQAQMDWRSKDDRGAVIAKEMSDRFFVSRKAEADLAASRGDVEPALSAAAALSPMAAEGRPVNAREIDARAIGAGQRIGPTASSAAGPAGEPVSDEFFPKGSFIDFRA